MHPGVLARLWRFGLVLCSGIVLVAPVRAAEGGRLAPVPPGAERFVDPDPVIEVPVQEIPALRKEEELVPVRVAGPFENPWSIAFLPEGGVLVTERAGRLRLVGAEGESHEITGLPDILVEEHAGLLDIALDPDFAANRTLYLSYSAGSADASTMRVLRARLDRDANTLREQHLLFESAPPAPSTAQLGGRIALGPDGFLFLSLGDRWEPGRAQELADHAGSIVRIRTDGTVPADNPLAGVPKARPEVWSWGHRNPQGLAFEPGTDRLWSTEHGPQGGDELNLIRRGRNYGWPVITYGIGYDGKPIGEGTSREGMEQPVQSWVPSIAPSGLAVKVQGERRYLFAGALAGQMIVRLVIEGGRVVDRQEMFKERFGRIRDVRIGPDDRIWFVTDDPEGFLWRLDPVIAQVRTRTAP